MIRKVMSIKNKSMGVKNCDKLMAPMTECHKQPV